MKDRTGISLNLATDLVQDREKWVKLTKTVIAHFRPTPSE